MQIYNESLYIYLDPAKDVFFSGEGNFQAKLKKPTQQTVLVSIFVTSALFLSLLRHFGVMFSIPNLLHVSASCFLVQSASLYARLVSQKLRCVDSRDAPSLRGVIVCGYRILRG